MTPLGRIRSRRRVEPATSGPKGLALLVASALSAFAVVWVLFYQLTLLSGALGFLICWYACFLMIFWVVTNQVVDRSAATDRVAATVVATCAAIVIGALLYIVIWVVLNGIGHFTPGFLWRTMKDYQPAEGRALRPSRRRPGHRGDIRGGGAGGGLWPFPSPS